jgi:hypothetical protein
VGLSLSLIGPKESAMPIPHSKEQVQKNKCKRTSAKEQVQLS